jgi:hypothetical protein
MRLVTRPHLQISQMVDPPAAIVPSPRRRPAQPLCAIHFEGMCELLHSRARIASGAWPQLVQNRACNGRWRD